MPAAKKAMPTKKPTTAKKKVTVVRTQVKSVNLPAPPRVSRKGKAPPIVYNAKNLREEREAEEKARGFNRPVKPNDETINYILDMVESGMSLTEVIHDRPDMPSVGTWYNWMRADQVLADRYARAKQIQCEALAYDVLRLSNTPLKGTTTITRDTPAGTLVEVREGYNTERTRLMVEARRWYLEKIMPKKFGNSVQVILQSSDDKL